MIRYKKYQSKREDQTKGLWYGRAVITETLDLAALAEHMAKHNTPFSSGTLKGVLNDMIFCIKELVLDGKAMKLDDLAIFKASLKTSGAQSADKFTAATNITAVRLRCRATGKLKTETMTDEANIAEYGEYSVSGTA